MPGIKKFFECLIPVTACNLRCEYCYVIQRAQDKKEIPSLNYKPEIIGKALTQRRLGGVCYFSICGAGETFLPDYLIDIVYQLLKNGHFVSITTNGTLTNKIKRLETLPKEWLKRVHIAFSFHYLELQRLDLLECFFANVSFVKELGCSFLVQLNLYDNYIPYLAEIKKLCIERLGAAPQLAATRKEKSLTKRIELLTERTHEEYQTLGRSFESPLFEFTMKNFNIPRKEFCYAGDWSYVLNLKTGILKRCYASCINQNIFENPEKPLRELAVGNCCGSLFCMNSSHFMSLGVIPKLETPTYRDLRDREQAGWYSEEMVSFLSGKLGENNEPYTLSQRVRSNLIGFFDQIAYRGYQFLKMGLKRP